MRTWVPPLVGVRVQVTTLFSPKESHVQDNVLFGSTARTVDNAPVGAKIEAVADDRLEVVLHEPLLDQVRLRKRAPDLFRRIGDFALDDDR